MSIPKRIKSRRESLGLDLKAVAATLPNERAVLGKKAMHENTQKALRLIDELIAGGREAAFDVVYSDFPDRDVGPDEAYEAKIDIEYNQVLDELAAIITKRYGAPMPESPTWANLRVTGWRVGSGVIFTFLERDDWDTPLSIVVGRSHSSSHEMDDDPWSYERKDA